MQNDLLLKLGIDPEVWANDPDHVVDSKDGRGMDRQEFLNQMIIAMHSEVTEFADHLAWKHWKKSAVENTREALFELVDLQHFIINCAQVLGCDANQFFAVFVAKNVVNEVRADGDY